MKHLVAILGPTGSGKSDLALDLARKYHGEVVNADSRQAYRHLDIGTAKPPINERNCVPHHLFDIVDPDRDFNLADFQRLAYQAIDDIQGRGKLPLLVGGSGLYVWAVLEGWQIPRVPPNLFLRQEFEKRVQAEGGAGGLFQQLKELDPTAAGKIDPRNVRRVIRALEVRLEQEPYATQQAKKPPPYCILVLGVTAPRPELYRRIDRRVDKMIERGLVEEVKSVLAKGFGSGSPGLNSVGYKEAVSHLNGELEFAEMVDRIKSETHRLVRHQYNWFQLSDQRIHWLDSDTDYKTQAGELIDSMLRVKCVEYGFY